MDQLQRLERYGYMRCREARNREIADGRNNSLAMESANQIKHLKDTLRELVIITRIHSDATGNNFAWAEVMEAEIALNAEQEQDDQIRRSIEGQ